MACRGGRWPQDRRYLPLHGGALTPSLFAAWALCRALGDAAVLTLFGACLFAATLVPAPARAGAMERAGRIARGAVPLALGAALARLPLTAAGLGDGWRDALDPAVLRAVLVETATGRAWALQFAADGLMAVAWLWRGASPALAWASGAAVASLALSGHAAAVPGLLGWLVRGALVLHLLAGGAWIGSLPEVLHLMAAPSRGGRAEAAATALKRFSAAGHGAVALVIATGALDAGLVARMSGDLPGSAYGALLLGKLGLAAAMTGLAVLNRYRLAPRLSRDPAAVRALRANTRAVLGLGLGAVALSGILGLLDPP